MSLTPKRHTYNKLSMTPRVKIICQRAFMNTEMYQWYHIQINSFIKYVMSWIDIWESTDPIQIVTLIFFNIS